MKKSLLQVFAAPLILNSFKPAYFFFKIFLAACVFFLLSNEISAQAPKIVLEESKNGPVNEPITPTEWIKGHLNQINSHHAEGQVVPYRAVVNNIPLGCEYKIQLSFHIERSGRYATDFLTDYTHDVNHFQLFGHNPENIDPLNGLAGSFTGPVKSPFPIAPHNPLPGIIASNRQVNINFIATYGVQGLSIWNGTISSIEFTKFEKALQYFEVTFTPTSLPVVFAWGGHIANHQDYGTETAGAGASALGGISDCLSSSASQSSNDPTLIASATGGFTGGGQQVTYSLSGGGGKPINPTNTHKGKETTETKKGEDKLKLAVYPNPSNGKATVILQEGSGIIDVSLMDFTGKIIRRWNGLRGKTLELELLNSGMYLLNVRSRETGKQTIHKIVVHK